MTFQELRNFMVPIYVWTELFAVNDIKITAKFVVPIHIWTETFRS